MWTIETSGHTLQLEDDDPQVKDLFRLFNINEHAWKYFGIMCFNDRPGFFPQLKVDPDEQPDPDVGP